MLIVVYISLSFNKFVAISLKKYYLRMKQIEISCKNSVEASRNRDEVQIYFNGRYFDLQNLKLAGPWKRLFLLVSENIGPSTELKPCPFWIPLHCPCILIFFLLKVQNRLLYT